MQEGVMKKIIKDTFLLVIFLWTKNTEGYPLAAHLPCYMKNTIVIYYLNLK